MALSGVMTRMPRVCMSIVASALKYGWAPTLMPLTTTLISPPAWVKCTIRRSAAATQSMFSVPESMAILAAEDDHPLHALGVLARAVADRPDHDARAVRGRRPVHGDELAVLVEVVLDELQRREDLDDLRGVERAA